MSYSDDVLGRFIQWSLSQRADFIGQFYAELQTDDLYHLVDHLSVAHLYALFFAKFHLLHVMLLDLCLCRCFLVWHKH